MNRPVSKSQSAKSPSPKPKPLTESGPTNISNQNKEKHEVSQQKSATNVPDDEFYFPRHNNYDELWKIALNESVSHWLTSEEYHKTKWLTAQRIKRRPIDRGNIQSRWRKFRLEDKKHKFGVSKYGVGIKHFDPEQQSYPQDARVDLWRDPDDPINTHHHFHHTLVDQHGRGSIADFPLDHEKNHTQLPSVNSAEKLHRRSSFVRDPGLFYREKGKEKKVQNSEESYSDSNSPEKHHHHQKLPGKKFFPIPRSKPRNFPPRRNKPDPYQGYDFVYFNARKTCIMPPTRPVPVYVDDKYGTKHKYCTSGLATVYVNKPDFGRIPEYLQKRNNQLGRPPIPDFRKFYRPHVCKYVFGHTHCHVCRKMHPCNKNADKSCGDPFASRKFYDPSEGKSKKQVGKSKTSQKQNGIVGSVKSDKSQKLQFVLHSAKTMSPSNRSFPNGQDGHSTSTLNTKSKDQDVDGNEDFDHSDENEDLDQASDDETEGYSMDNKNIQTETTLTSQNWLKSDDGHDSKGVPSQITSDTSTRPPPKESFQLVQLHPRTHPPHCGPYPNLPHPCPVWVHPHPPQYKDNVGPRLCRPCPPPRTPLHLCINRNQYYTNLPPPPPQFVDQRPKTWTPKQINVTLRMPKPEGNTTVPVPSTHDAFEESHRQFQQSSKDESREKTNQQEKASFKPSRKGPKQGLRFSPDLPQRPDSDDGSSMLSVHRKTPHLIAGTFPYGSRRH